VSTTVTIDYAADTSGTGTVLDDDTCDLNPGASCTILHDGTDKYVGAATVTSDNGAPLVAIVNQVLPGTTSFGTAYEGFSAADATDKINVPLVMANNSGFYTGIQVQNVSSTDACNVTIAYGENTAADSTYDPDDDTCTLSAGESCTHLQSVFPEKYVGSANITADCDIVAIVNEANLGLGGDQFYTFDAFNYD
jgi:hypothetical protein